MSKEINFKLVFEGAADTINKLADVKMSLRNVAKEIEQNQKSIKTYEAANAELEKTKKRLFLEDKSTKKTVADIAENTAKIDALKNKYVEYIKTQSELRVEQRYYNQDLTKAAKAFVDSSNSARIYDDSLVGLKNKLSDLIKQYSLLDSTARKTKAGMNMAKEIRTTEREIDKLRATLQGTNTFFGSFNNALRGGGMQVTSFQMGVQQLLMSNQSLTASFGTAAGSLIRFGIPLMIITKGFELISGIIGGVKNNYIEFQQAQADLAAILYKSVDAMGAMTQQALNLGAATKFTASEISLMQTELAKLGFSEEQILKMGNDIAVFAIALDAQIPEAAETAGAALRAFNLDVTEMNRVVNVMGKGAVISALDFQKIKNSVSNVMPVANAFNFTIEDTVALLAGLSNAGFEASKASVAIRNIFLHAVDPAGDLAQRIGFNIRSFDDLARAFRKLRDENVDLGEALELTDKRSVSAFETFLAHIDTVEDMREQLYDTNNELQRMADTRLDTFAGQITQLKAAWDKLTLASGPVKGITDFFKNRVTELRNFIMIEAANANDLITFEEYLSSLFNFNLEKDKELIKLAEDRQALIDQAATKQKKYNEYAERQKEINKGNKLIIAEENLKLAEKILLQLNMNHAKQSEIDAAQKNVDLLTQEISLIREMNIDKKKQRAIEEAREAKSGIDTYINAEKLLADINQKLQSETVTKEYRKRLEALKLIYEKEMADNKAIYEQRAKYINELGQLTLEIGRDLTPEEIFKGYYLGLTDEETKIQNERYIRFKNALAKYDEAIQKFGKKNVFDEVFRLKVPTNEDIKKVVDLIAEFNREFETNKDKNEYGAVGSMKYIEKQISLLKEQISKSSPSFAITLIDDLNRLEKRLDALKNKYENQQRTLYNQNPDLVSEKDRLKYFKQDQEILMNEEIKYAIQRKNTKEVTEKEIALIESKYRDNKSRYDIEAAKRNLTLTTEERKNIIAKNEVDLLEEKQKYDKLSSEFTLAVLADVYNRQMELEIKHNEQISVSQDELAARNSATRLYYDVLTLQAEYDNFIGNEEKKLDAAEKLLKEKLAATKAQSYVDTNYYNILDNSNTNKGRELDDVSNTIGELGKATVYDEEYFKKYEGVKERQRAIDMRFAIEADEIEINRLYREIELNKEAGIVKIGLEDEYNKLVTKNRQDEMDLNRLLNKEKIDQAEEAIREAERIQKQMLSMQVDMYQGIGESLSTFFVETAQGNVDATQNMVKGVLSSLIEYIEKYLLAIVAASMAQPDSIVTFGASGLARVGIISALISGAFAGLKGTLLKHEKGGELPHQSNSYSLSSPSSNKNGSQFNRTNFDAIKQIFNKDNNVQQQDNALSLLLELLNLKGLQSGLSGQSGIYGPSLSLPQIESLLTYGGLAVGNSHSTGGIDIPQRNSNIEGGEIVINRRSSAIFKNLLSAINAAGGGIDFAGTYMSKQLQSLLGKFKFEAGGVMGNLQNFSYPAITPINQKVTLTIESIEMLRDALINNNAELITKITKEVKDGVMLGLGDDKRLKDRETFAIRNSQF